MEMIKRHEVAEKFKKILELDKVDRVISYMNGRLNDETFLLEISCRRRGNPFYFDFYGYYSANDIAVIKKCLEDAGWHATIEATSRDMCIVLHIS